nr:hypothetical protein [Tanacetum cinerariifolium]
GCGDEVMASAEDGDCRSSGSVVEVIIEEVWCSVLRNGGGSVTAVVKWGGDGDERMKMITRWWGVR